MQENRRTSEPTFKNIGSGTALSVGGIVLCGGESSRMGRPKEWLQYHGEYLLSRIVGIASRIVSPVVVAARANQSLPPLPSDIVVAYDSVVGRGPLAGLAAGMEALSGRCHAAFVTPCDHPDLSEAFIRRLVELLGSHSAVVPKVRDHLHPLSAVYRLSTLPVLCGVLDEADHSARAFADRCGARQATESEFRDVDPVLESLRNVNTLDDLDSQFDGDRLA